MPRIGLCVQLSEENKPAENLRRMSEMAREAQQNDLDALFFGEAYIQGFDSLVFQPDADMNIALSLDSETIKEIRKLAIQCRLALGFGFYELDCGRIFASYLVFDRNGQTICHYRRISPGWRIPDAPPCYREGAQLSRFTIRGTSFGLMVCGDFWTDSLMADIKTMDAQVDAVLWPVHCDYPLANWEASTREAYRERTKLLSKPVLFVNNLHLAPDRAKGGAYCWHQGVQRVEMPAGQAGILETSL